LIAPDNHFTLAALLFAIVAFALWFERFPWGKRLTATVPIVLVPLLASNAGLIPTRAPAYAFMSEYFVAIAVPLLLFKADLRRILRETGRVLTVFLLATAGSVLGGVAAFLLVPVGPDADGVAATVTAGNIGGFMNIAAVAKATGIEDPTRFGMVFGSHIVFALAYFIFLSLLPNMAWFRRWTLASAAGGREFSGPAGASGAAGPPLREQSISIADLSVNLGLSLAICAAGTWMAGVAGLPRYSIIFITVLAVVAANVAPGALARLRGGTESGLLLMYLFFAAMGAQIDLVNLVQQAPVLVVFGAVAGLVHFVVAFGAGRLLGFAAPEVAIASNACLLGPSTAAALAATAGWKELVVPGVLCGVFGYAIANFVGIALAALL
jgi:uncharacterized membrane protein